MDLFVSPSREDAFPLAILEAMRAGLPIIATKTQGPLEMLAGQPAQMVACQDVPALGRAMRRVIEQLQGMPRSERPPVAYDLAPYNRDRAVQAVVDFYETVTTLRRRAAAPVPETLQQPAIEMESDCIGSAQP
jgi:glycosyltransferase involved in cell wall biosynthesis